jgi:UDPglucose 6-dehydrogenase
MVRQGVGSDERIGSSFLFAGCGYGGSCFPKDVKALIRTLEEYDIDAGILTAVEDVNAGQKQLLLQQIDAVFPDGLQGRRVAVWGLSFKPDTDDMREAASLVVVDGLLARGAHVVAHDPEAMTAARGIFGDRIAYVETNYDALDGADMLVVITEWRQYRVPDFQRMRELMRQPVIFDGRNLFDPARLREQGFDY